jgi:uncharacterized protein
LALAYNTRSEAEVDAILDAAEKAGGRIVKPAKRLSGVDGPAISPILTVICGKSRTIPDFPIDEEGRISLPE